jgi:hypothetical protein
MQNVAEEDKGKLDYQRGKKLAEDFYIISVHDNAEKATVTFSAYELESSDTFALPYSYSELDALFRHNDELANPANRDGRYEWVVERLDLSNDGSGVKRLYLASEPTPEDIDGTERPVSKKVPTEKMSYAERQKQRAEVERLEDKRSQNIAQKTKKAQQQFLAALQETRRLAQLKAAARAQRIGEEQAERRERDAMKKRLNDEKVRRYDENDKKRQDRVLQLEEERKNRDLERIMSIIQEAVKDKKVLSMRLEEAREKKREADEAKKVGELKEKAKLNLLDEKRDMKMTTRLERQKDQEEQYLTDRQKGIDKLARDRQEKQERKATFLYEKAAERATALKEKHANAETWERLQDQRTRAELKREHDRSMLAYSHIEELRSKKQKDDADAAGRKRAAIEERKEREAKEAEILSEQQKVKSDLEQRRNRNIGQRESVREQNHLQYVESIRNEKTAQALAEKEKMQALDNAKARSREQRQEDRKARKEQEDTVALLNSSREEAMVKKTKHRDLKVVDQIKSVEEADQRKKIEAEAVKKQKKLMEAERINKAREEAEQKKVEWERLQNARADNQAKKEADRVQKEKARLNENQAVKAQ